MTTTRNTEIKFSTAAAKETTTQKRKLFPSRYVIEVRRHTPLITPYVGDANTKPGLSPPYTVTKGIDKVDVGF